MIVSFKFYVLNYVEILLNYYSHITSHVSPVFASCTHYASYSLLNIVHVIVCDFFFGHLRLTLPWVLCKICLKFENLRKIDWKSYFLENWVQNKCFWKTFHLILMHSIQKILCFEEFPHKIALVFSKTCFFPEFRSIEPVSQSIEIAIKILVWTWPTWSLLDQSKII